MVMPWWSRLWLIAVPLMIVSCGSERIGTPDGNTSAEDPMGQLPRHAEPAQSDAPDTTK